MVKKTVMAAVVPVVSWTVRPGLLDFHSRFLYLTEGWTQGVTGSILVCPPASLFPVRRAQRIAAAKPSARHGAPLGCGLNQVCGGSRAGAPPLAALVGTRLSPLAPKARLFRHDSVPPASSADSEAVE